MKPDLFNYLLHYDLISLLHMFVSGQNDHTSGDRTRSRCSCQPMHHARHPDGLGCTGAANCRITAFFSFRPMFVSPCMPPGFAELDKIEDIVEPTCPVRYGITVQKLREGSRAR